MEKEEKISCSKQLSDLLKLVFLQTTPPWFYYRYSLYRYSSIEWFDFIYTHELPNWHQVMSPNLSSVTRELLSDKSAFARHMQKQGLSVIDGHVVYKRDIFKKEDLFQGRSLFFKPLCGSQNINTYSLECDAKIDSYILNVSEDKVLTSQQEIMSFLQELLNQQDYLIQPLLQNHKELQGLSESDALITIRLISIWAGTTAQAISAVVEIPIDRFNNRFYQLPIEMKTGIIQPLEKTVFSVSNEVHSKMQHISGHQIAHWSKIVNTAIKAHKSFPDIFSVGWDLAITPEGVKLIEGNINWGVAAHQTSKPSLMKSHILYTQFDTNKSHVK
ncbi:MAG: sugar-transfer associated ATP-grasp domain-containing protein [Bacteroidota bacterium]|nr:sugar-transfer associated ATP-grasp domain-containing protein [Bacteroidota bacterium]